MGQVGLEKGRIEWLHPEAEMIEIAPLRARSGPSLPPHRAIHSYQVQQGTSGPQLK